MATFDPIFGPSVGSFCGDFLSNGFFDSLVGLFTCALIHLTIKSIGTEPIIEGFNNQAREYSSLAGIAAEYGGRHGI
jgi:hypothetical protein